MPVKIMRIEDAPTRTMPQNRGKTLRLVDEADGAKNVDVHINLLNARSGMGPTHYHAKAENIYVVLEGILDVIIEGKNYRLNPGEVAFIPPGTPHAAGNHGDTVVRLLEIYSPPGQDFQLVDEKKRS
jgi:mannose-6-phosphate isomerase-like protein (cupin superfamily)